MATSPTTPPDIAQVISDIPLLKPRNTVVTPADQDEFVTKYEATNDHLSDSTVPEINTQKDEQNTLADWMETTATEVYNNALEGAASASAALASETAAGLSETNAGNSETAAALSETNAGNSEAAAQALLDNVLAAPLWVSGTSYGQYEVVTDPLDFGTYKAKIALINSIVEPSNDSGNWANISGSTLASGTTVDAAGFTGNLSPTDTDVQTALETIDALDFTQQLPAPTINAPADTVKNTPVSYTVSSISLEGTGTRTVTLDMGTINIDTPTSSEGVAIVFGQTVVVTGVTSTSISVGANYTSSGTFTVQAKVDAPDDSNYSESNYSPSDSIGVLLNTPALDSPADSDIDTNVVYTISSIDAQSDKIIFDAQSADITFISVSSGAGVKVGNTIEITGFTGTSLTLTLQYTVGATYNNRAKVQDTGAIYPDSAFSAIDSIVINASTIDNNIYALTDNALDTGTSGNDGTANNVVFDTVKADFNGTNANIDLPFDSAWSNNIISISMMVNPDALQTGDLITSWDTATTWAGVFLLRLQVGGTIQVGRGDGSSAQQLESAIGSYSATTEINIIFEDDGSNFKVYIDNVLQGTYTRYAGTISNGTGDATTIGSTPSDINWLNGKMRNVVIRTGSNFTAGERATLASGSLL